MPIPDLTHLQIAVLGILLSSEQTGRYVREQLAKQGARKTGPAFYQMMSRLEESGFVTGRYDQKIVAGQIIKERVYKITGAGLRARQEACDHYAQQLAAQGLGGLAHA